MFDDVAARPAPAALPAAAPIQAPVPAAGPAGSVAGSPPGSPAGSSVTPAQMAKIRKSAQEFEAMAVGQLLQPMFSTVNSSKGLFGGGKGEAAWKPMMVDEMAKMLAKAGGIGIAATVMREMLIIQEKSNGKDQA